MSISYFRKGKIRSQVNILTENLKPFDCTTRNNYFVSMHLFPVILPVIIISFVFFFFSDDVRGIKSQCKHM